MTLGLAFSFYLLVKLSELLVDLALGFFDLVVNACVMHGEQKAYVVSYTGIRTIFFVRAQIPWSIIL